jgi:hypothetical protein
LIIANAEHLQIWLRIRSQMKRALVLSLLVLALCAVPSAQQNEPSLPSVPPQAASADQPESLSADEIRALIQRAAENDIENDKKLHNYTYFEDINERRLDSKGEVKSTETKTREIMMLYGSQVERLVAKNGKPLSAKEAAEEDQRIQKIVNKRRDETPEQAAKRLKQEEKEQEDTRRFVREVADAYNFRELPLETIEGRETYVIDAEPRPGFEPHSKEAKFLPKFRFRVWIDKAETQWVKLDAEAIDTVSVGLFLARIHKGSRIVIKQTKVNQEVWLPQRMSVKIDVRLALLKDFNVAQDVTYRDYKKFRSNYKIIPPEEGQP